MRFLLNLKIKELVNKSNSDLDLTIKPGRQVIIDFNLISDLDKILDENLLKQNIHLIILFNSYSSAPALLDLYKFDKNALIINKKDILKSIQKKFFSKVIKQIIKNPLLNKDTYSTLITDEDLDVKNIIIKDNILRYN